MENPIKMDHLGIPLFWKHPYLFFLGVWHICCAWGGGGVEMEVSLEKMLEMVYHDFIGYFQMIFMKSENDWILNIEII